MAAKLLHTLADENSDLQKKIGCMNGIFQLFDRHHVRKSLTLGNAHVNSITFGRDSAFQFQDSNVINATSEKLTESSSRVSFSSSSCSSSSLLSSELNREETQPEISPYDRVIYSESPTTDPVMTRGKGFAAHMGLDLRDVVRDSMYREVRGGLSEVCRHKRREEDSPRPCGFNDSCKALAQLRTTSHRCYYNEVDIKDSSHNKLKSGKKDVKESPRLSLESIDHVDLKSGNGNKLSSESFSRSTSMNKQPPSVVAKLMGLETLPGSPLGRDKIKNMFDGNIDPFSRSPRWRSSEFVMKPLSSLRFPTEPAPWKQTDRRRSLIKHKPLLSQSLERRFKGVEFKHSGKEDLRALNVMMLEATQRKSVFGSRKQPQCSNSRGLENQVMRPHAMRGPIVIIKPARLVERSGIPSSSLIPIHSLNREEGSVHVKRNSTSKKVAKELSTSSVDSNSSRRNVLSSQVSKGSTLKNSESASPRLRQVKNHEDEKCSRPPTTSSDSSKSRKQTNRLLEGSTTSPGGRRRPRAQMSLQQNNDQQCSTETEATMITRQATEAGDGKSPTVIEATKENQWNPAYSFSETATSFSPEINWKKLRNVEHLVQKLKRLNSNHDETSQDYIASLCENNDPTNTDQRYISEILLASGLLLRDLGSELTTFQLHASGHPINPELFLVLEQTKGSSSSSRSNEKLNRKLVFDAVNETLLKKLVFEDPWTKLCKAMKRKVLSAQQLLKEVCSEIETVKKQAEKRSEIEEEDFLKCILDEDVATRSEKWTDFDDDDVVPCLVLDLERLLFKDLVSEVVHGEIDSAAAASNFMQTTS
ncbi:protein LONGIFOLIA 1-like [Raphanus sativus]|uniref:Protein LONGIFOLIA 1-like n=1 Tax=Raphanus sativus TaxID=3726 RepID=A0A6J0KMF9_RAPSA|nr:protein LONGIFOLIA 1-like [Raphanus sativus]